MRWSEQLRARGCRGGATRRGEARPSPRALEERGLQTPSLQSFPKMHSVALSHQVCGH